MIESHHHMIRLKIVDTFQGPALRLRHVTPVGMQLGYIDLYSIEQVYGVIGMLQDLVDESNELGVDIFDPVVYHHYSDENYGRE